jgi:hypothetical protein
MTYYQILDKTNKTGVTNGVGTAYPSGEAEIAALFCGVRVAKYFY